MESRTPARSKVTKAPVMELPLGVATTSLAVEWELEGSVRAGTPIELRFVPSSDDDQLRGSPGRIFNEPKPGEVLIATLLAPKVGESETAALAVTSSVTGGPIHIEARIRRPV